MRTRFHRLGAGVLLMGAAMLGGCLNTDKPVNKYQPATQKQAANSNGQQVPVNSQARPGANGQSNDPNAINNGQPNQFRTNNSTGTQPNVDPNARIGITGGPANSTNPANYGTAADPRLSNSVQPAGGLAANPNANPNLRPIATSNNNPNAIQPILPNGASPSQSNLSNFPPLDPTPRNSPAPVSMQGGDRDLNGSFPRTP